MARAERELAGAASGSSKREAEPSKFVVGVVARGGGVGWGAETEVCRSDGEGVGAEGPERGRLASGELEEVLMRRANRRR